jgi:hypothetical protein
MRKEMIFVLAVILSLSFANFASAINDPIAHWKFDETSGLIAEDSAGDNDGTLVNEPVWATGIIDGALEFDGVNDYVALSHNAVTTMEFTVAAWANHYGPAGGADDKNMIFSQRDDSVGSNRSSVAMQTDDGFSYTAVSIRSSIGSTQRLIHPMQNYYEWHHYAMTVSSDDFVLYVDGVEVDSALVNQSGNYWTSIDHVHIGRLMYEGGLKGSFNGAIDEVIIYNRALSAAEIEELYLGEEPELVGLEITGPDEVPEDSQTQYSAIALYDNNSTADVTDDALWSVEPNVIADIEAGLLTTEKIFQPEELEIYAQYTEDGNTFDAEKAVSVFAICPSGTALEFDGLDDYVDIGDPPDGSLDFGDADFTLSTWFKTSMTATGFFVCKRAKFYPGYDFYIEEGGEIFARIADGSSVPDARTTETFNDDLWHHAAAVYDRDGVIRIYVDGVNKASSGTITGIGSINNSEPFTIADRNDPGYHYYFNGLIDDVRVYDRALSAQEIQMSMHVPLEGNEPNLVGYWDFDEGEGQVAHDTSGNGNDGQLGSGPDADDSDPNWADSDAPVGICTLQELVERNVNEALEIKLNILDEILEALAREDASVNILDGLFGELEYGYLDKRDIGRAEQEIHSAIQSEEQAIHSVEKSVGDLEDSLDILAGEDGAESNSIGDSKVTERLFVPSKR